MDTVIFGIFLLVQILHFFVRGHKSICMYSCQIICRVFKKFEKYFTHSRLSISFPFNNNNNTYWYVHCIAHVIPQCTCTNVQPSGTAVACV